MIVAAMKIQSYTEDFRVVMWRRYLSELPLLKKKIRPLQCDFVTMSEACYYDFVVNLDINIYKVVNLNATLLSINLSM
ncbi:MAG: hypothetical protein ACRD4J_11420 [Nitrososphaeraceae archaeon]